MNKEIQAGMPIGSEAYSEKIKEKRSKQNQPELSIETKELVEEKSNQILQLQIEAKNLFDGVKNFLPSQKTRKVEGKEIVVPVTDTDLELWASDGTLQKFLVEAYQRQYPDRDTEELEGRVESRVEEAWRAIDLKHQAELMTGISSWADKKELVNLSDEELMINAFYKFRLKEFAESGFRIDFLENKMTRYDNFIQNCRYDGDFKSLDRFEKRKDDARAELYDEVHSSPEAYYRYWGKELMEAQKVFTENGKIYETPYVKSKIGKIMSMLRVGQPVFIHGETGSGKTEVAKYIAKSKLGKDAEVISGRRGLEISEVTEAQVIKPVTQTLPEIAQKEIAQRVNAYVKSDAFESVLKTMQEINPDKNTGIIRQEESKKFEDTLKEYNKNRVEITSKLQPFFRAARDGKMVIIDEMNAIPHHTLIALNDLLTKKPLDEETYTKFQNNEISVDQISEDHKFGLVYGDKPIVIAPGFCVVGTGNWKPEDGINYVGRQTIDTAYLRRFGIIDYDYLPNPIEGTLEDQAGDLEAERKVKEQAELYKMLCARIIDKDLSANIPKDAFTDIENLSQIARLVQEAFSGREIAEMYLPESLSGSGGKLKVEDVMKENVLDIGKIVQYVIEPWKKDNFRYPLDHYLFDRYISRSKARPQEMLFLYKIFQLHGFFEPDNGWPGMIDLAKGQTGQTTVDLGSILNQRVREVMEFGVKLESSLYNKPDVKYNKEAISHIERPEIVFYSPTDVVDKIVGKPNPRTRYPDLAKVIEKEGETETVIEDPAELEKRSEVSDWIDSTEGVLIEAIEKNQGAKLKQLMETAKMPVQGIDGSDEIARNNAILDKLAGLKDMIEQRAPIDEITDKQKEVDAFIRKELNIT